MHDRILNPYLLFKAQSNDSFSACMHASFHTKKHKIPKTHAYRAAVDTENSLWRPVLSVQAHTVCATKKRNVQPQLTPTCRHALVTHNTSDDFVLVNRSNGQKPQAVAHQSSCVAHVDTENEFVFIDCE